MIYRLKGYARQMIDSINELGVYKHRYEDGGGGCYARQMIELRSCSC